MNGLALGLVVPTPSDAEEITDCVISKRRKGWGASMILEQFSFRGQEPARLLPVVDDGELGCPVMVEV
jgi:hypothetical protein